MAGLPDYSAQKILDYLTGQVVLPALPSVYAALFQTAPTTDGVVTTGTECSGTNYARVQVAGNLTATSAATTVITFASVPTWVVAGMSVRDVTTPANVPAATTIISTTGTTVTCSATVSSVGTDVIRFSAFLPSTASSGAEPATTPAFASNTSAIITWPQAGGTGWGTAIALVFMDAASSGNALFWDYLGNNKWLPFTCSVANPGILTSTAHGYVNGNSVVVTTKTGGALPSNGTWTGLLTVANSSADTFTCGVNTSAGTTGDGLVRLVASQPIAQNVTMSIAAGSMTFSLA